LHVIPSPIVQTTNVVIIDFLFSLLADQYKNLHRKLKMDGISSLSLNGVKKEMDKLSLPEVSIGVELNLVTTQPLELIKRKMENKLWREKIVQLKLKQDLDITEFPSYSKQNELLLFRHCTDGMKCSRQSKQCKINIFEFYFAGIEVDSITIMNVGPKYFNSPKFGDVLTLALGTRRCQRENFFPKC